MTGRRTKQRRRAIQATLGVPYTTAAGHVRRMDDCFHSAPPDVRRLLGDRGPQAIREFVQTRAMVEPGIAARAA